jgi:hypothetical protein
MKGACYRNDEQENNETNKTWEHDVRMCALVGWG